MNIDSRENGRFSQERACNSFGHQLSSGTLHPPQARKLIVDEPRCSVFYCLPKIHKPNNPGRPIVSTISCPTSLISKFVDSVCQPLVKNTPSYLKDTNHALTLLNDFRFSGRNRIIITGDVNNLYTVIDHAKGLRALRYFLDKRAVKEPATDVVVRLAELVLSLNAFEFDSSFYKQVCGVAMGTRMGPSFACLYLAYLEEHFFASIKGPRPEFFRRYIDDLLFIFSCTPRQAQLFLNQFAQCDPDLKFTWSSPEQTEVPFLDIKLQAEGDGIRTSVYSKETDTHAYLLYSSFHPRPLLNSIPYSQFLRIRRLCSADSDFNEQCAIYGNYFRDRGYPDSIINEAIARARGKDRISLLNGNGNRTQTSRIPLVLTHTPTTKSIAPQLVKLFDNVLVQNPDTNDIFPNTPIRAFRKPTSLRKLLVSSRLRSQVAPDPNPGTFPCGRNNCGMCTHTTCSPQLSTSSSCYRFNRRFSCESECVIYALTCDLCRDAIYIGQTKRRIADRFREHVHSITSNSGISTVSSHFNLPGHCRNNLRVSVLTFAPTAESRRLALEKRLIFRFQAYNHPGLNQNFHFI